MKTLLVCEQRQGVLLDASYELLGFSNRLGAEAVLFLVGSEAALPLFDGKLYLADAAKYGDYNPALHKQLILEAVTREKPDLIVFLHSSYGWDLAPRLAASVKVAQLSEVLGLADGLFELPCCNSKLHRQVEAQSPQVVLTIQMGAFSSGKPSGGAPQLERLELPDTSSPIEFVGYEAGVREGLDLTHAQVIVSAGRGIGKKENLPVIQALAAALGGELGATRPIVDAGWLDHSHQVGTTGQVVHPKLYVACGISGSIQHLAGMKGSDFIVAINKDKDAPIGTVADVLVVADVLQFVPILTSRLQN